MSPSYLSNFFVRSIQPCSFVVSIFFNKSWTIPVVLVSSVEDVFGPLAFDNSISKKSADIKGVKNIVAGDADVLLVPSVETGNSLVKMMIYFMGACAAGVVVGGKVPIVITSRSDEAQARLASIAAAVVALD